MTLNCRELIYNLDLRYYKTACNKRSIFAIFMSCYFFHRLADEQTAINVAQVSET